MDRGVCGVCRRVGHDLATVNKQQQNNILHDKNIDMQPNFVGFH